MGRLAPPLCSILGAAVENADRGEAGRGGAMAEGSLEMLAMLLRKSPPDVACNVHALAMAPLMRLMTVGSDAGQLQSGTEVLRLFLKTGGEAMLSWNGADANSSMQVISGLFLPRRSRHFLNLSPHPPHRPLHRPLQAMLEVVVRLLKVR